jgi:hypothetical protein
MKKIIASILVCGFAIAFVACGGGKKAEEAAAKAKADSTRVADSTKAADDAAAARVKAVADSTAKADSVAAAAKAPKKK